MTIKLEDNNTVHIPISLKNDDGIYNMKLKHSQTGEVLVIPLMDNTPLNRFATFIFELDIPIKKGSYTYTMEDDSGVVRRGIAYYFEPNVSNKDNTEYKSDKEIIVYE